VAARSCSLALLVSSACVYPATEPTGIEFSWRFVERNVADGEDLPRVRSCAGAVTEQIAMEIADLDDPTRHGTFRFDCLEGYQTAVEFQTAASDAFVLLDPGLYFIGVRAVDHADNAPVDEFVAEREVEVEERGIAVETWEISRAPVAWDLELRGLDVCDTFSMALHYASPETDLAEFSPASEDSEATTLYRQSLASDQGLEVGGVAVACTAQLAGAHHFGGIDRGEYRLVLEVDGFACAVLIDLRPREGVSSVIDLANLPCGS